MRQVESLPRLVRLGPTRRCAPRRPHMGPCRATLTRGGWGGDPPPFFFSVLGFSVCFFFFGDAAKLAPLYEQPHHNQVRRSNAMGAGQSLHPPNASHVFVSGITIRAHWLSGLGPSRHLRAVFTTECGSRTPPWDRCQKANHGVEKPTPQENRYKIRVRPDEPIVSCLNLRYPLASIA